MCLELAIQPKQNRTSEALASIQAVLHRLFAGKQTQISEALASMDKSASQFESVGVSRSCFALANQTR
ncbi:hypothetical protein ACR9JV_07530 [Helicobacter pylori]